MAEQGRHRDQRPSPEALLEAARRESPGSARVVLTGYPSTTVASRAFQQDVDLMLLKPWKDEVLRESVRKLLADRVGHPGLPS